MTQRICLKPIFFILLFSSTLFSCGNGVTEKRNFPVREKRRMDSPFLLDKKNPNLTNLPSIGEMISSSLSEIISKSQNKKLKWKYSQNHGSNDEPPYFDCEGYVRFIYRTYLNKEPWEDLRAKQLSDHSVGLPPALNIPPIYFKVISYDVAKRGDLVVWRKKDGYENDHVALFDGVVVKNGFMAPMVISTSSSSSERGEHVIERMPLEFVVQKKASNKNIIPLFLRVLP